MNTWPSRVLTQTSYSIHICWFPFKLTSPHLEKKTLHWAFSLKRIFLGIWVLWAENLHVFFWGQSIESWGQLRNTLLATWLVAYRHLSLWLSGMNSCRGRRPGQKDTTWELNNVVRIMSMAWYCSRRFREMLHWGDLVITWVMCHPCQMHWRIQSLS